MEGQNLIGIGSGYLGPGIASQEGVTSLAKYILQKYDRGSTGSLDNTEVASIMMDLYRSVNKKFSPSKYDIDTYGKIMDYNGDGRISQSDLENLIKRYLAVDVEITRTVSTVSKSTVSKSAIPKRRTLDLVEMNKVFEADDLDKDGFIGRYEFGRIVLANAKKFGIDPSTVNTDEIFKQVDTDADGKINFNEFVEGVKKA